MFKGVRNQQPRQPAARWSLRLRVRLTPLVLMICAAPPALAARLALVMGNDNYVHVKPALVNARNDARLMAQTLQSAGFEIVGGVRENPGRAEMWRAINQFKNRIGRGDEVVFFFAGHGVQLGASQMLLPVDIEADSADQLDCEGLPLQEVQDRFRDARFALLIIGVWRHRSSCRRAARCFWQPAPGKRRWTGCLASTSTMACSRTNWCVH